MIMACMHVHDGKVMFSVLIFVKNSYGSGMTSHSSLQESSCQYSGTLFKLLQYMYITKCIYSVHCIYLYIHVHSHYPFIGFS